MSDRLTLVSHHLCPYVQRAAIALDERAVPFERLYVDLANKPAWFQAISPLGKVPLLKVEPADSDPVVIFESAVILEFLEDTQQNPLHPRDAYARARHRAWIEFGSATLNAIGRFYSATTGADLRLEAMALAAMFDRIEAELASRAQQREPWFGGDAFSLVDAVWAPIFRYFDVFDEIGDFGILSGKPHLQRWRTALSRRPSVIAAVTPDYPERLRAFLRARRSHLSELLRAADLAMAPA